MRKIVKVFIIMTTLLVYSFVSFFLVKPTQAFWQMDVSGGQLKFTTGDWTAPKISATLQQADKSYLVDELVSQDCQIEDELTLDETGFTCRLVLSSADKLPQWLSFQYQVASGITPLLPQPRFTVEIKTAASTRTVFTSGVGPGVSDDNWRYGWLSVSELSQFIDDQGWITLIFKTLPAQIDDIGIIQPQVRLRNLSTLRLTANPADKLKLVADESVTWQIDYQVNNEVSQLRQKGQEVEISLDELGVNARPNSWQIKAVDQAGNESQVLRPRLYIIDDNQDQVAVANLKHHQEADGRLSLRLDVAAAWLDQVMDFRLRQKEGGSWREIELVKLEPFVKPTLLTSVRGERVVLATLKPISSLDFCLETLTLVGDWEELVCTD